MNIFLLVGTLFLSSSALFAAEKPEQPQFRTPLAGPIPFSGASSDTPLISSTSPSSSSATSPKDLSVQIYKVDSITSAPTANTSAGMDQITIAALKNFNTEDDFRGRQENFEHDGPTGYIELTAQIPSSTAPLAGSLHLSSCSSSSSSTTNLISAKPGSTSSRGSESSDDEEENSQEDGQSEPTFAQLLDDGDFSPIANYALTCLKQGELDTYIQQYLKKRKSNKYVLKPTEDQPFNVKDIYQSGTVASAFGELLVQQDKGETKLRGAYEQLNNLYTDAQRRLEHPLVQALGISIGQARSPSDLITAYIENINQAFTTFNFSGDNDSAASREAVDKLLITSKGQLFIDQEQTSSHSTHGLCDKIYSKLDNKLRSKIEERNRYARNKYRAYQGFLWSIPCVLFQGLLRMHATHKLPQFATSTFESLTGSSRFIRSCQKNPYLLYAAGGFMLCSYLGARFFKHQLGVINRDSALMFWDTNNIIKRGDVDYIAPQSPLYLKQDTKRPCALSAFVAHMHTTFKKSSQYVRVATLPPR